MKMWNRTTMEWRCDLAYAGLEINIPVDDMPGRDDLVHSISACKAVSQPDQCGRLELQIKRCVITPTTKHEDIIERLKEICQAVRENEHGFNGVGLREKGIEKGKYPIWFTMSRDLSFCDAAIKLVRGIFDGLGVEDKHRMRLSSFRITQETLVPVDEGWITYARWLRMYHRLNAFSLDEVCGA
ncbi:MAG: hypothetical protein WDZ82_01455 [Candidatus Paceibacterota bacterium]